MKAIVRLMAVAAILWLVPSMRAADLSGTWKGSFEFNGASVPVTLNLKVADTAVSGTIEGLPTSPVDIHEGKIDGPTMTFWINTDYEGQTYKIVYHGKISADSIDFDFGTEDGSWGATMTAKRDAGSAPAAVPAAVDVSGSWAGAFDFNGTSVPVTFKLKSDGGAVTGTVEGMGGAPVDIHDGKIEGDTVSFTINVDYQGQTYALNYKGKIAAGQINFDFGTSDGSWGASVSAKKS
ncbi:MAG TPA: hypothetical protein VGJ21_05640 [Terracidiphilus sp.]|jgi:hypothetical protein